MNTTTLNYPGYWAGLGRERRQKTQKQEFPFASELIEIAKRDTLKNDISHDLLHTMRVLKIAMYIAEGESGDIDIVFPAALFHDIIVYPKNTPQTISSSSDSATRAVEALEQLDEYPQEKIIDVRYAIEVCSWRKGIRPTTLEAKILQDADRIECTGTLGIMRTFASAGIMNLPFYNLEDPLDFLYSETRKRKTEVALDLFRKRLLLVKDQLHTETAKELLRKTNRHEFLTQFLDQLKLELS